jgi:ketol-acid reductoisomerase
MTTIFHDDDADLAAIEGSSIAIVGYGNQGRSWALNLRDSGFDVQVCVRAVASREQAADDGFEPGEIADACDADVVCVLVPDDVIQLLDLKRPAEGLTILASGYTLAFDRFDPDGDVGMVAPRMLGPEVRACYEEGSGFITAVGVHRDVTDRAQARTLAVAKAIGGLRQGAIELSPRQEAILDLAEEQVRAPVMTHMTSTYIQCLLEHGIPLEAIIVETLLSGETERTMRLVREHGYAYQFGFHSPTSQYGQLSRRDAFAHLDPMPRMRELVADIASGRFADEWDEEARSGGRELARLKALHCGEAIRALEASMRERLGPASAGRRKPEL